MEVVTSLVTIAILLVNIVYLLLFISTLYSVEMSDTRSVDRIDDVEVIELEGDGSRPS